MKQEKTQKLQTEFSKIYTRMFITELINMFIVPMVIFIVMCIRGKEDKIGLILQIFSMFYFITSFYIANYDYSYMCNPFFNLYHNYFEICKDGFIHYKKYYFISLKKVHFHGIDKDTYSVIIKGDEKEYLHKYTIDINEKYYFSVNRDFYLLLMELKSEPMSRLLVLKKKKYQKLKNDGSILIKDIQFI